MVRHWNPSINENPTHVTVALLGRFKGKLKKILPIITKTVALITRKSS